MSIPQNNYLPTNLSSFDDPSFDEDVLFDDYCLSQEPFLSEDPDNLETPDSHRDELYEDVQETTNKDIVLSPASENHKEPLSEVPQEESDVPRTLSALDILLHPPMDIENNIKVPEHTAAVQLQDQSRPKTRPSSVNINSLAMTEEPFVQLSGSLKFDTLNFSSEVQNGAGLSISQAPELSLPTSAAVLEDQEMIDIQPANMDLALMNSVLEGNIRYTQGEGRPLHAAFPDICEDTFTTGMFPDILHPAPNEENPAHSGEYDTNNTQMPPPKRQRKVAPLPTAFSEPVRQSLKRTFVNLESSTYGHASVDGSERRKKRTRTRIEDMDPSMVHVCKFPGCTKKFAKKYNLKIHQRRHNGDLPFLCEYAGCAKRFMWLSSFSRHLRVHEARRNGGRRRREVQVESEERQNNDTDLEREPDIAISNNFSILSVSGVKVFIENELSEDVTFACALTALDSRPCENLIPVAQTAQAKRRQLLTTGRSEDFYQQQTMPYDLNNANLQEFRQLIAVTSDLDGMINDSNPVH